jgi:hypothetical protein
MVVLTMLAACLEQENEQQYPLRVEVAVVVAGVRLYIHLYIRLLTRRALGHVVAIAVVDPDPRPDHGCGAHLTHHQLRVALILAGKFAGLQLLSRSALVRSRSGRPRSEDQCQQHLSMVHF